MKVTLLRREGKKEVINRVELADLATAIRNDREDGQEDARGVSSDEPSSPARRTSGSSVGRWY